MISTCIIQGGEAPVCFSNAVADLLVYDEVRSPVCLEDIPDLIVIGMYVKYHKIIALSLTNLLHGH